MAAQIENVCENGSEITVIAKILISFSSNFRAFQNVWDSVDPTRQTLSNLEERLIREKVRLNNDEESASAFVASKRDVKTFRIEEKESKTQ